MPKVRIVLTTLTSAGKTRFNRLAHMLQTLSVILVTGLVLAACGRDVISGAGSCAVLEDAWRSALSEPVATAEELHEINEEALSRVVELVDEAEARGNALQVRACNDLFVDIVVTGGAMDPSFDSCPDGRACN